MAVGVRLGRKGDARVTFSVFVEAYENRFTATLVGAPEVRVTASTRAEEIAALKAEIAQRVGQGELISLEVQPAGVVGLAAKYASDPTLAEISRDAYLDRDARRPA